MNKLALRNVFSSLLLVAAVLAAHPSLAEGLRADQITRWAESTKSVQAWAERQAPDLEEQMKPPRGPQGMQGMGPVPPLTPEQMEAMGHPMSNLVKSVKASGMAGGFSSAIAGHGFSSMDKWGELGDRIVKALVTLQVSKEGDPRAEMSRMMAEMQGSQHISEAQLKQIMAGMESSLKMLDIMADAPPEDVEAVRPHMPLLENMFSE